MTVFSGLANTWLRAIVSNLNDSLSFRLFARPSFLEGVGRVLDLGSNLQDYNRNLTPEEADKRALEADWRMVGRDMAHALSQYEQKET